MAGVQGLGLRIESLRSRFVLVGHVEGGHAPHGSAEEGHVPAPWCPHRGCYGFGFRGRRIKTQTLNPKPSSI